MKTNRASLFHILVLAAGMTDGAFGQTFVDSSIIVPTLSANMITVNSAANMIYTSGGAGPNQLAIYNGATLQPVITTLSGSGAAVNPKTNRLYAGNVSTSLLMYDATTGASLGSVTLSGGCFIEAAVDTAANRIWVAGQCGGGNDPIVAIDGGTSTIASPNIGSGGVEGGLMVNPVTHYAYISPSGVPKRITPGTWTVTSMAFSGSPWDVDPVTNLIYVLNAGRIDIVSGSSETVVGSIAGSYAAVNSAWGHVYTIDNTTGRLRVYDAVTQALLDSVQLPPLRTSTIAANSTTGRIFILGNALSSYRLYVYQDKISSLPPSAPTSLSAAPSNAQVALKWKKNPEKNIRRYRIYMGTSAGGESLKDSTLLPSDTSKTIISLTNGTVYYFRVTAVDSAGRTSGFSTEVSAKPMAVPSTPNIFSATPATGQVTLVWMKNPERNIQLYRIYAGATSGGETLRDSTTLPTDTVRTITSLTNGTPYFFRVTAVDSLGQASPFSNEVAATPGAPPSVPANLSATPGDTQVLLTWSANPEKTIRRYRIYMGTSAGGEALKDSTSLPTDTSKTITALTNLTQYYFRVSAVDSSGQASGLSAEVSTTPAGLPSVPTLLGPADGATGQAISPTLQWGGVLTSTQYRVQVSTSSTFSGGTLVDTNVTATSAQVGPLGATTTYYWHVRAKNGTGTGNYSSTQSFATGVNKPVVVLVPTGTLDVGNAPLGGAPKRDTLVIRNAGGIQLNVTAISISGAQASDFALSGISFPMQIAPTQSAPVPLTFTPAAFGRRRALLTIASNDAAAAALTDSIAGTGIVGSAPAAPGGLKIAPSGWSASGTFVVTWTHVVDPSGIAKLLYRLDTQPTPSSPGDSALVSHDSATIGVANSGVHTVYCYLADSAGMRDPSNTSTVVARVDRGAPVIVVDTSHIPTFDDSNQSDVAISASSADALSGMKSLELQYRGSGRSWGTATLVTFISPAGGTVTIPGADVFAFRLIGVEFRVKGVDSVGNVGYSRNYSLPISLTNEYTSPISYPGTRSLPAGTSPMAAYRLVSIPINLNDKTPFDIFESRMVLGAYDRTKWRFFSLNVADEWDEYPMIMNTGVVIPGRSFLFISRDGMPLKVGPGTIVRADSVAITGLPLRSGFNLVGNPFAFPLVADSLALANGQPLTGHRWGYSGIGGNSGWNLNPDTLKPWGGWLIDAGSSGPTTLRFSLGSPMSVRLPGPDVRAADADPSGWNMRLIATRRDNGMVDEENLFGVASSASDDRDESDIAEPPQIGNDGISLSFASKDGPLTHDIRSSGHAGWTWDFTVRSPGSHGIIDVVLRPPAGKMASGYLLDLDAKFAHSLADLQGRSLATTGAERHFRIVVGSDEYLAAQSQGIELLPRGFEFPPNYPNPFNPTTTIRFGLPVASAIRIEVYDVLGRLVDVLADGPWESGFHELLWTPRMASGIYFCRIEARAFDGSVPTLVRTRKMVLLK